MTPNRNVLKNSQIISKQENVENYYLSKSCN